MNVVVVFVQVPVSFKATDPVNQVMAIGSLIEVKAAILVVNLVKKARYCKSEEVEDLCVSVC